MLGRFQLAEVVTHDQRPGLNLAPRPHCSCDPSRCCPARVAAANEQQQTETDGVIQAHILAALTLAKCSRLVQVSH